MCWKFLNKENRLLDNLASIATILAVIGAIWIGIWQNNINSQLKDLAERDSISSQTPLLSAELTSLKIDKTPGFITKELRFSNKGSDPINVTGYVVSFPENPHEPLKQVLSGTIFQGESIVKETVENKFELNEPVQMVEIKVNFVSLFNPKKEFCARRSYLYLVKNQQLVPNDLSEFYECDQPPSREWHSVTVGARDASL